MTLNHQYHSINLNWIFFLVSRQLWFSLSVWSFAPYRWVFLSSVWGLGQVDTEDFHNTRGLSLVRTWLKVECLQTGASTFSQSLNKRRISSILIGLQVLQYCALIGRKKKSVEFSTLRYSIKTIKCNPDNYYAIRPWRFIFRIVFSANSLSRLQNIWIICK